MKNLKLLSLIIATATSITINAQTIALHSSAGVQIFKGNTALALAYTSAQSGDTLYLSGGTFTPPAAFDKQLMIFGAGHYVDSTLATGKTFINGNLILTENADLFYLEGVELVNSVIFATNHSVNNATVKRCKINDNTVLSGNLSNPSSNLALIGNVFVGSLDLSNATNVLISNNIFQSFITVTNGNQISNNIFFGGWQASTWVWNVFGGNNNQVDNNIFIFSSGPTNGIGNSFRNNVLVPASPNYGTAPTEIGNYVNIAQSAIFVNQTGNLFDYAHDYHLQSPTTYLGLDGSQVGIYGGIFPYKEGAVPLNPHIQLKNISSTTNVNGDLQIQIRVEAQNE